MSTSAHPKQFMDILGTGQSLLQQTFSRLLNLCSPEKIFIVTNERYRNVCLEQLPEINEGQVLCEPERKNTAPCIAYAYQKIRTLDPDSVMVVTPSDHLITRETEFVSVLKKSMDYAINENVLLTIGIKPGRPDTGYGYIHFDGQGDGFVEVKSFTEKPDLQTARKFVDSGEYSWNSGMFIWNSHSIDRAFQEHLPAIHNLFVSGAESYGTDSEQSFINEIYPECESISIDYGILEKSQNVEVINADFGWSDLGTWGSLYEHIAHDSQQNAIVGKNVVCLDSGKNIVHASDEKLVVLQGLDDFIVVDHGNTLLICRKEDEQKIKQIVEKIGSEKGLDFI